LFVFVYFVVTEYLVNGAPQAYPGEPHSGRPADAGVHPLGSDDYPTFIGKIPESQLSIRPFANVPLLIAGYQQPFTLQATEPGYFQHLTLRSAILPLLLTYFNDAALEKVPGE
jgi:hypothetical protein